MTLFVLVCTVRISNFSSLLQVNEILQANERYQRCDSRQEIYESCDMLTVDRARALALDGLQQQSTHQSTRV